MDRKITAQSVRPLLSAGRFRSDTFLRSLIIAAAVAPTAAWAGVANDGGAPLANPVEYEVSASGATALGALTRGATTNGNNFPTGEQDGLWRLGTGTMRVGRTVYTLDAGTKQLVGLRDKTANYSDPNVQAIKTADRMVYQYHEVGSINGVLATVKGGGLFIGDVNGSANVFGNELAPELPSQGAPRWRMGWSQVSPTQYVVDGNGALATTAGGYSAYQPINVRIGFSDVRSFQAFAADNVAGAASPDRRPRDLSGTPAANENAQYGAGRKAFNSNTAANGTNFQALANRSVIAGESGTPGDSYVRNETLAIVPFAVAANPGTGLGKLGENDVRFLNGIGRLSNGANFNSVTREIGSGTRNQGANNTDIDPSWAGGERDRRSLSLTDIVTTDVNGQSVTIRTGDEVRPDLDLYGNAASTSSEAAKEHRVGPMIRFSDKNSGGSGVRPVVLSNRMAVSPNLSVGDVGARGRANLTGSSAGLPTSTALAEPMRVLAIDWNEQGQEDDTAGDDGFVQPTAHNITNGRYQMWSAAQATTVIGIDTNGDGRPDRRGTVGEENSLKAAAAGAGQTYVPLIWNDTFESTDPASTGIHRKFLDNVRGSVSNYPGTSITPADAVIDAGFVPEQVMKVTKDFDGGAQTWSNSPAGFNASLHQLLVTDNPPTGAANLKSNLNWHTAGTLNGNLTDDTFTGAAITYKIFAADVPASGAGSSSPTKQIAISTRTVLAGDMNNDQVRDLADVADLARAYAASETHGGIAGAAPVNLTFGTQTLSSDDLIVLTDFNGDGNISGTNAAPVFQGVDRDDVIFFVRGASVDTLSANPDTGYAGSNNATVRREDGVRLGKLKKNAAVDVFNAAFLAAGGDASKVLKKGDVDGDGAVDRVDARIVDALVGVAPYSLTLAQVMVDYDTDPIYAELTDDNMINATGAASDFSIIRAELGAALLAGDANFDGTVSFPDLLTLAKNYNASVDRWSRGDFNSDGTVGFPDLLALAKNYNQTATGSIEGDWALAQSLVPEPTALGTLCLAGLALSRRRRASR